jgi:hypothetical protein
MSLTPAQRRDLVSFFDRIEDRASQIIESIQAIVVYDLVENGKPAKMTEMKRGVIEEFREFKDYCLQEIEWGKRRNLHPALLHAIVEHATSRILAEVRMRFPQDKNLE